MSINSTHLSLQYTQAEHRLSLTNLWLAQFIFKISTITYPDSRGITLTKWCSLQVELRLQPIRRKHEWPRGWLWSGWQPKGWAGWPMTTRPHQLPTLSLPHTCLLRLLRPQTKIYIPIKRMTSTCNIRIKLVRISI